MGFLVFYPFSLCHGEGNRQFKKVGVSWSSFGISRFPNKWEFLANCDFHGPAGVAPKSFVNKLNSSVFISYMLTAAL
jgi:hypothetical protein